jgi:AAA family ATP:ADP antiporter
VAGVTKIKTSLGTRAAILFTNFFLIILAYYQVKSASRSLLIEYWGAGNLPYVWIASAGILLAFISIYNRLVERYSRLNVVLASCLLFIAMMVGFYVLLDFAPVAASVGFYIFVDIISVILVEQFWSLTDTITRQDEGRQSYWFVSSGGLVGSIAGGTTALMLLQHTPLTTADLLLSSALILAIIFLLNLKMGRMGLFEEVPHIGAPVVTRDGLKMLASNRYIQLIAAALLCAQIAQPLVEFQFMKSIEENFTVLDERTAFISGFFGILGFISISINLLVTPLIHRFFGVIAGLLVQPLALFLTSVGFMLQPTLFIASAMKISDRGLSYSINRASKEQLYIPVEPVHTYQAKAWIDMLGYRLFKVIGSLIILMFTQGMPWLNGFAVWIPVPGVGQLSWFTLAICMGWIIITIRLGREYRAIQPTQLTAKPPRNGS